ncbi:MFS transporter [Paenibacillus sambharensis]|uniref:MFS transporter n=1 Tax=Paenibacillus sambharensis TaxID=1803190 RepID=A0A2W1LAC6_9BACL|nr:MFS transporter [Paenibacillus sambharensis]PZD95090.1 MFS transporter [Paenibacillus sambharensis]
MEQGKHTVRSRLAAAAYRLPRTGGGAGRQEDNPEAAGKLDKQAVLLLIVQSLHGIATALSGTFVPVYLWKASQSFSAIGWFTLSQHLISGLTFWLVGKWVKEYNKMNSLRAGVVLSGLFYSSVLLLGKQAAQYVIPLGMLNGVGLGFFWMAYNVVYFEITEPDNRDRFNGWAGLLGSGAGIIAPWLSGLVIGLMSGDQGYRIIFTVSLVIFGIATLLSFFLAKRESVGKYEWLYGFRELGRKGSLWRSVTSALFMQGMREGLFMFLLGLLVFLSTGKEQSLGNFTFWTSLVGLMSFLLVGRRLNPRNRSKAMLVGTAILAASTALLLAGTEFYTLLALGVAIAIFMPLYVIPMTSAVFDMIGSTRESAVHREELIVLREAALITGRAAGLIIFLSVVTATDSKAALTWLLIAVGAAPLPAWLFMRRLLTRSASSRPT